MIRLLIKTLYFSLLIFIFLAGITIFLITTTPGLQTIIDFSRAYIPGTLTAQHLKGNVLHGFTLDTLEYQYEDTKIKIKQLKVQWFPESSFKNHLVIAQWHQLQGALNLKQKLNSPTGTLTATAMLPHFNLNLNAKIKTSETEYWQMKTRVLGTFPWQWTINATLSQLPNTLKKQTGLHANLSLRGIIKAKNQGNLVFTIHPGYYQLPDHAISTLAFKGGTFNMTLSPEKLSGLGNFVIDHNQNIKLDFQLPHFTLSNGFAPQQKINGVLTLEIKTLDFLQNISPEVERLKGQLIASLKAKGTLEKPQIESQLLLKQISLYLPRLKLHLDSVDLNLYSKEKHWNATGTITSSAHHLLLKGHGLLDTNYVSDLTLEGTNFPLMQTSEYQINVSPQLKLHLTPSTYALSGLILIPSAQIKLQTLNNSISLPDEVVYTKQQKISPSPMANSTMDVTVKMGEDVMLDVKGLKGHVDGSLIIKKIPQGTMNAHGELSVRDGTYKAYGQDLSITQGQLIFTGGAIDNPGINLRAAKKINNTSTYTNATQLFDFNSNNLQGINPGDTITLGIEATGRLTKPHIQLYSKPAIFSQADILSMLVLGRPASQANKAGGQLLLAAISSMNVGNTNSTQLLEQLKQSSGLDFNIQTSTNYNQLTNKVSDSTTFVVGKSLSKRLYLSYNIGLSQTDTNMLTLKYILNKFFSIQVSTSDTSSAIDFLYTSSKKKNSANKYRKK